MQKEKNYMKKKILICGADGYLGWPTAMYLSEKGYQIWEFEAQKITYRYIVV